MTTRKLGLRVLNGIGVHAFVLKYRLANKERPGLLLAAPLCRPPRRRFAP
ncbi:MAG: hypothetical protein U0792_07570 [Gemmataceae bacterium]